MASISIVFALIAAVHAINLWEPSGPYHDVGYSRHLFNVTKLPNDFTEPGNAMLLTIYYPTSQVADQNYPYLDPISASIFESTIGMTNGSLAQLTTRLQYNASVISEGGCVSPTLVLLPGGGLPSLVYTAYLSELASHGYVVVAIDHAGEAPYLPTSETGDEGIYGFPDFTAFPPYPNNLIDNAFAIVDYHAADVLTAVSEHIFPSLVKKHGYPFNTTHYGIFGHSVGGASAATVMENETSLFKAGVNMDGTYLQFYNSNYTEPISKPAFDLARPFLEFTSQPHFDGNISAGEDDSFRYFEGAQSGWLRTLQVNGTGHLDFSDLPLWLDLLDQRSVVQAPWVGPAGEAKIGTLNGERGIAVVSRVLRSFFGVIEGNGLQEIDQLAKDTPELFLLVSHDP